MTILTKKNLILWIKAGPPSVQLWYRQHIGQQVLSTALHLQQTTTPAVSQWLCTEHNSCGLMLNEQHAVLNLHFFVSETWTSPQGSVYGRIWMWQQNQCCQLAINVNTNYRSILHSFLDTTIGLMMDRRGNHCIFRPWQASNNENVIALTAVVSLTIIVIIT